MAKVFALLAGMAALLVPGVAHGAVTIAPGADTLGYDHVVASSTAAADDLRIVEVVDGVDVGVPAAPAAGGGIEANSQWTCTTARTFAAIAGNERSAPLTVTSPSCADRLHVAVDKRVGLRESIRVSVFDRWHLGNLDLDVCAMRASGKVCRHVATPAFQFIVHTVFAATHAGEWKLEVADPMQAAVRASAQLVVVREHYPKGRPTLLATGDSMMETPTTALKHRLSGIARVIDDVYVGSGISRPFVIDWAKLPARQVRVYHPDAVVVSIGMGDGRDLPSPAGPVVCCGPAYVTAYAQRVRAIMRTYSRNGRGAVVWINDPFQRNPDRHAPTEAVNAAVALAAQGLDRVKVIDIAAVLTPGGTYRPTMVRNGKKIRIRTSDGIHMAPAGARIATGLAVDALRRLGVKVR